MENGKVKFFNEAKGFGFIVTSQGDLFCHVSQRAKSESRVPKTGDDIYFERVRGSKGPMAAKWQLSAPAELADFGNEIDLERDRRDGYRPGVMIALRLVRSQEYMIGHRRGIWTTLHSVIHDEPIDAPGWMYSWGVPQGGIEEGETCEQAIRRELDEELGSFWSRQIVGEPKFLFKERTTFRVEKDGKVYRGKTLYAFLVVIDGVPDDYVDWMYGSRQDEFWTLPTPEFEGGIQFYDIPTAREMIARTQRGAKGAQLVKLLERAHAA